MKTYAYNHNPIKFDFLQSVDRFIVEEIPLYKPSSKGEYLFLEIKKHDLSTWRLIHVIKQATGADDREIGYAGLKDKNATTTQMISLPKRYEKMLVNITTDRIEVLSKSYNKSPLKIGHLKGNRFEIVLNKLAPSDAKKVMKLANDMSKNGIPNYFGYQRFGEDGKSWQQGKEIADSGKRLKGAKESLLVSSYQGYLFNKWLSKRVYISKTINELKENEASQKLRYPLPLLKELCKQKQFFKLFIGDCMMDYPYGKETYCKDMLNSADRFAKGVISPTGLLAGEKAKRAVADARYLEEQFDDEELVSARGDRRLAWIYPSEVDGDYDEAKRSLRIKFALPRGSYATTFLEEIGKISLKEENKR